ncbi:MAG TPA: D-Ala-D-Ala carboxypeptidase family metallohydrolase [Armatimonadota bacterium]
MTSPTRLIVALLLASLAGRSAAWNWTRALKQGDAGADVQELQIRVAGWASDAPRQTFITVDGDYGPATAAAVRRYQFAYRLPVTGVVSAAMETSLNALEDTDASTRHFDWSEFTSHDGQGFAGGAVPEAQVKENIRRLMYKLEALRFKLGGSSVSVNSGFRSVAYNASIGGAGNSMHTYGVAADIEVAGHATPQVYQTAETCGFSGLEAYTNSWQHCDSRMEYTYGSQFWWWESGLSPLIGSRQDPPTASDISALLARSGGLANAAGWMDWDTAPSPSADPRGLGDGRISVVDAVRALRRGRGLESVWP